MKKTGPMSGTEDRTGIVAVGIRAIAPALLRSSPRTRARPLPRNVRARPETTCSAWKVIVMTAWRTREQAAGEHPEDEPQPGVAGATAVPKATTAPISIIPSTPRLMTPARSAKISPTRGEQVDGAEGDTGGEDDDRVHQAARRSIRNR